MTTKTLLVLGCGPAGLMAAQAADELDYDVRIVGIKRKSEMYGAQYLHAPIPGASPSMGFDVKYLIEGDVEGYKKKVYGPGFRGTVSPDELAGDHMGWDIRATYGMLWSKFQDVIVDHKFNTPQEAHYLISQSNANHVVSTIPAPMLCGNMAHGFSAQQVWAVGDAPERGVFCPITSEVNTVTCSGNEETSWYRKANILGYNTCEWPAKKKPPIDGVSDVLKPTATNCDCLPDVHRAGRYGKWSKGVLSHSAYQETLEGLKAAE